MIGFEFVSLAKNGQLKEKYHPSYEDLKIDYFSQSSTRELLRRCFTRYKWKLN